MTEDVTAQRAQALALAKRYNNIPFAMFGAWLGITVLFWIRAVGLRAPGSPAFEAAAWPLLAASIAAGLIAIRVPRRWYVPDTLQREARLYERLGMRRLRAVITDGDRINRKVRTKFPDYRVHAGSGALAMTARRSFVAERAHHGWWWFGIASSIAGLLGSWPVWGAAMFVGNVATNLLPMILQRYTRARLIRVRPDVVHAGFERPA